MNKEMICKNCKYHYIEDISFDYPQSCCDKRKAVIEEWFNCNDFEYSDKYIEQLQQENKQLKECYCNRTDCSGRIKNSRKYDSLYQKYNKQLDNWNKLKEFMKKEYDYLDKYSTPAYGCAMGEINRIKNKMQEMEKSDSNAKD